LGRNGTSPSLFSLGSSDSHVGFGLVRLQSSTDVVTHVDVGDVDRNDFVRCLRIQSLVEHRFGNQHWIGENLVMSFAGADGRNDSFANSSDNRVFRGAADQLSQVGANGHSGTSSQLNAVLGDAVQRISSE